MFKAKRSERATQVRFFRFVSVGGVVAATQFAVLALVRNYWNPKIAFTSAFVVATAVHYSLNKLWALPSERRDSGRQLAEYLVTVVLSYLINLGIFTFALSVLNVSVMWAALCAVPPATLVVFLLLNYRVFRARL
jgi:putative flippase GtrA